MKDYNKYTFAVIALGHLGDTILVEPLCRNIKDNFPNSQIIFIVNNLFKEIPLGFDSVDKIISYDKYNLHKGILGFIKFIISFPYKKIDYAIITHPHERSLFTAIAIGAKEIISRSIKMSIFNIFITKKLKCSNLTKRHTFKADFNSAYLTGICEIKSYPVNYIRHDINIKKTLKKFNLPEKYIVLSPTSKESVKDWDYYNIKEFIINNKIPTVIVGVNKANEIANKLLNENINFIDLTNKTSITELGAIIKKADTCISVDTGTFHLSYAQNVKTIGLFFNSRMLKEWAPDESERVKIIKGIKYKNKKSVVCIKNITADDVLEKMREFEHENNKCMPIL